MRKTIFQKALPFFCLVDVFKAFSLTAVFLGLLTFNIYSHAGVVVVVNPSLTADTVSKEQIANIFLGKVNKLPSGEKVVAIDQEEGEDPRTEFYQKVVRKDSSQLNAYWSRLIFTGKGQPPKAVLDDDEVLELVASDPAAIGYISSDSVDDTVKVIFSVD